MTTSTAQNSQGTTIAYSTGGSPGTFVPITNVTDISGFDGTANDIDITTLTSTAKEHMLGLQDWGSLTLSIFSNFKEASHLFLLNAKKAGTLVPFKVTLADGSTISFSAFVKSFPIDTKVDAAVTSSVALTISGDITLVVGV